VASLTLPLVQPYSKTICDTQEPDAYSAQIDRLSRALDRLLSRRHPDFADPAHLSIPAHAHEHTTKNESTSPDHARQRRNATALQRTTRSAASSICKSASPYTHSFVVFLASLTTLRAGSRRVYSEETKPVAALLPHAPSGRCAGSAPFLYEKIDVETSGGAVDMMSSAMSTLVNSL